SGYHRAVMAVPGRVTDENSSGTNRLIRTMKAVAVCDWSDVIFELGFDVPRSSVKSQNTASFEPTGDPLLDSIAAAQNGVTADLLSDRTGMPASEILSTLFTLELEGKIRKAPGGLYFKI
ncbi:MAG: DNA-protecting protein DprA, partial [Rikenellaceae bacterium]|nr:DNA-protecting protein DprA [Rikenellaceae bacterium]